MKLTMQLGSRSYDIILKSGCLANLYQFANVANRKVFILTDSGVPEQYAQTVLAQCPNGMVYTVPQGEASKSLKVYGQVLQAMLEFNMTRKDLLVAVGGGVVGDLGGFCAASYMSMPWPMVWPKFRQARWPCSCSSFSTTFFFTRRER